MKVHTILDGKDFRGQLFTIADKVIFKCSEKTMIITHPEIHIFCEEDSNCIMVCGFEQDKTDINIFRTVVRHFFPY